MGPMTSDLPGPAPAPGPGQSVSDPPQGPGAFPVEGRARRVAILGSTGSIGTQALQVISAHPDLFEVVGLSAGSNAELLAEQIRTFRPQRAALAEESASAPLRSQLAQLGAQAPDLQVGPGAAESLAAESGADVVLNAMTGSIGLLPTLAALKTGATLALANKESLVVGGALVRAAVQRPGQVVPVDSEHSALAQALSAGIHEQGLCAEQVTGRSEVSKLVLTASGGPFRSWSADQLVNVTPADALKHPNFDMGLMVTTNSATMVNKALEVIEAHLLFGVPLERIETVVHPQQYIHSLVEFQDGSSVAQAGPPRMLVPIALGLSWPHRLMAVDAGIDWTQAMNWRFEPLDDEAFPAVRLAKQAAETSATHMAVFNAANEQAVAAFHAGALAFPGILSTVEKVLAQHIGAAEPDVDTVLEAETWARAAADQLVEAAASLSGASAGAGT